MQGIQIFANVYTLQSLCVIPQAANSPFTRIALEIRKQSWTYFGSYAILFFVTTVSTSVGSKEPIVC
jgi:K+-transporting ATPase A subunit